MKSETVPALPTSADAPASAPTFESLTYTVPEAAQVIGVSLPTIYRLVARRLLRPVPGMRHKRLPKKQVHAFVHGPEPRSW